MTNTINVPRELLLELRDSANDCYNNEVRRYKDDRRRIIYKALVDKADAILAQPAERIAELQLDADRYRWLRHMTTKERAYIVQQEYDKVMDMFLDESMKGGRNE